MKNAFTFAIIGLILIQITLNQAITCSDGQYLVAGGTKCSTCPSFAVTCSGALIATKLIPRLVGHEDVGGTDTMYCGTQAGYNKNTGNCENLCK